MIKLSLKSVVAALFLLVPTALFSKTSVCISDICIEGNTRTKSRVITNELPFKIGDYVTIGDLNKIIEESRNNLLNLSLFNFVNVFYSVNNENTNSIIIHIKVEERWYYWPMVGVVFEDRNLSSWLKNRDWNRITVDAGVKIYNIKGLNHTMTASYKYGFQRGVRFEYENVNLDKKGKHLIDFYLLYLSSKTIKFRTLFNTPSYFKDGENFMEKRFTFHAGYTYRAKINERHIFEYFSQHTTINDTVIKINRDYWGSPKTKNISSIFSYTYILDKRDNYQYPTKGFRLEGVALAELFHSLGVKYGQLRADIAFYTPIYKRWNASINVNGAISAKNRDSYILDKALGYDKKGLRGYEYYTMDGQHFLTICPTLRYKILPTKIITLNFLSFLPKFNKIHFTVYAKGFFDMGYVRNNRNHFSNYMSNRFLYSGGGGIDIVTYYDTVISIDYSFNQFYKNGLYFNVRTPLF